MKSNPPQDLLQRGIREWTNTSEKGQGHSQPKGKSKGKGKGKRKHSRKGTTTRTRLDLRMMKLDSARWVILVSNVRELNLSVMFKRMMILRHSEWIEQLCVLRSKVQQCDNGFDGIAKFVDESFFQVCMGVKSQRALMKNLNS